MNTRAPAIGVIIGLLTMIARAADPVTPAASDKSSAIAVPAKAAAPAAATNSDPAALAKAAASVGYNKPRQRDGKTVYCRKAADIGTRLESTSCITQEQVSAVLQRSQGNKDSVEGLQRAFLNQPPAIEPQSHMGN